MPVFGDDLVAATNKLSGLPESGYRVFDHLTADSRAAAGSLAVKAAGGPDLAAATTEFASAASAQYDVPTDLIMSTTFAVFDGTAAPMVIEAARDALANIAHDIGLDGSVGDGDYITAAAALLGAAAGGPIGAFLGGLLGFLINAVARVLSDQDTQAQVAAEQS